MMAAEWIAVLVITATILKVMNQLFANHRRSKATGHAQTDLSSVAAHQILEESAWLSLHPGRENPGALWASAQAVVRTGPGTAKETGQ